tara:strand:- start:5 stop:175 length:171 start_codon:yes stop_codon:yes gene_type:complete
MQVKLKLINATKQQKETFLRELSVISQSWRRVGCKLEIKGVQYDRLCKSEHKKTRP